MTWNWLKMLYILSANHCQKRFYYFKIARSGWYDMLMLYWNRIFHILNSSLLPIKYLINTKAGVRIKVCYYILNLTYICTGGYLIHAILYYYNKNGNWMFTLGISPGMSSHSNIWPIHNCNIHLHFDFVYNPLENLTK